MLKLRILPACFALAMLAACGAVPCVDDQGCPPLTYCSVESGKCAQDCVVAPQCGAGAQCSGSGRCEAAAGLPLVTLSLPEDGASLAVGAAFTVAGTVDVGAEDVDLVLTVEDLEGCEPAAARQLHFPGGRSRLPRAFNESGFSAFPGGGRVLASAVVTGGVDAPQTASRVYQAPPACPACPQVRMVQPVAGPLPPLMMAATVEAAVTGDRPLELSTAPANGAARILLLPPGQVGPTLVPLGPGSWDVGIQVHDGMGGSRVCRRRVEVEAEVAALAVHVSLGAGGEADLQVVPPGGVLGGGACRQLRTVPWCQALREDTLLGTTQAMRVPVLEDGIYGVAALVVPANVASVPAAATLTLQGVPELLLGPQTLRPEHADVWLIARVHVVGGVPRVEALDRIEEQAPRSMPQAW